MAGLKEIRRRLKSVANTRKITYAMKLVSAAKLRKTQDATQRSRQYTELLKRTIGEILAEGGEDLTHPLLEVRTKIQKIGLIVLGGARGLCGAYNAQLNRRVDSFYKERAGVEIQAYVFGRKPAEHFRRTSKPYIEAFENIADQPELWPTDELSARLESLFVEQELDEIHVLYTRFKSAVSMSPTAERVVPLETESLSGGYQTASNKRTIFEPSKEGVLSTVVPRIVRARIRQAALDTKASEHASRMTAMDAATKNAKELSHALTLERNRVRQSSITSQLLDIVGGAEALS